MGLTILGDPRYATHALRENGYELADAIGDILLGNGTEHWLILLRAAGVPAIVPKSQGNNQAFHRDPVNQAIGRIAEVSDGKGLYVREAAELVRVSDVAKAPHRLAPEFGADTESALSEQGTPRRGSPNCARAAPSDSRLGTTQNWLTSSVSFQPPITPALRSSAMTSWDIPISVRISSVC